MIYDLSWLYADSLNVVFITCFYGIGMPIMFPMAAIILLQQRLCQRIRVAYICSEATFVDDSITHEAYKILKYAPLGMLFNAYWMLDNHQIFGNDWNYINQTDEPMLSKHYFTDWHVC